MTSLTTWLVVFVLYVWGGPGVHLFAFVMVVGVIVGTYSSIYIASPLLLIFGEGVKELSKVSSTAIRPAIEGAQGREIVIINRRAGEASAMPTIRRGDPDLPGRLGSIIVPSPTVRRSPPCSWFVTSALRVRIVRLPALSMFVTMPPASCTSTTPPATSHT